MRSQNLTQAGAWRFIVLVGVVSLFSDTTYEGARSISGPFLGSLQASVFMVAMVAGLGEFLGYPCAWSPVTSPTGWGNTGPSPLRAMA